MDAQRFFDSFVLQRTGTNDLDRSAPIEDVLDSLALLDMYLLVEGSGFDVALDDIASCATFGELRDLLTSTPRMI